MEPIEKYMDSPDVYSVDIAIPLAIIDREFVIGDTLLRLNSTKMFASKILIVGSVVRTSVQFNGVCAQLSFGHKSGHELKRGSHDCSH